MTWLSLASIGGLLLLVLGSSAGCRQPEAEPRFENLVLVTIDTLRADHLGSYGYPRPVSPFLDSLAANGVRFERTIASSSHTAPSHASIFTSQYPARHRVVRNGVRLEPTVPNMAGLLGTAGFDTAAFVAMGFLEGVTAGFDTVEARRGLPYKPAEVVVDTALGWISVRPVDGRFFLWVHLYDVHNSDGDPAVPEKELQSMQADAAERGDELIELLTEGHGIPATTLAADPDRHNRYDAQIAFVDENVQRLFEGVESQTAEERTLWVITSDHGEGLGNHDYPGHSQYIYEEQLRVPLIVYGGQDWISGRVVDPMVRHVDLLPTVAELLAVPLDSAAMSLEGRSLVRLMESPQAEAGIDFALSQRRPIDRRRRREGWEEGKVMSVQHRNYKYIFHSAGQDELYDLESDPLETTNLVGQGLQVEKQLAAWLIRKHESMRATPLVGTPEEPRIGPEFIEELKALGYLN